LPKSFNHPLTDPTMTSVSTVLSTQVLNCPDFDVWDAHREATKQLVKVDRDRQVALQDFHRLRESFLGSSPDTRHKLGQAMTAAKTTCEVLNAQYNETHAWLATVEHQFPMLWRRRKGHTAN
jgi:hypothetical protein